MSEMEIEELWEIRALFIEKNEREQREWQLRNG
jgi:hypothetical protein